MGVRAPARAPAREAQPGERVLDLGCGPAASCALRDAGTPRRRRDRRGGAPARANTGADVRLLEPDGSIPLGHGEVDLVWCCETLEHVPDVAHALLEVRRVLSPAGACSPPSRTTRAGADRALPFDAHSPARPAPAVLHAPVARDARSTPGFDPGPRRAGWRFLVARAAARP